MLLAEDLLLLLTDDRTGRLLVPGPQAEVALGGALLVELSLAGRVDVDDRVRLVVRDPSPTGDAVLDLALRVVQRREGKRPSSAIRPLAGRLRRALYDRLVAGGYLRLERGRVLGLFPVRRWPTISADHEAAVRRALTAALVHGATPERHDRALIALLHALRATRKVVDPREHGVRPRALEHSAGELAEGDWGSDAVRQAVRAMSSAAMAAVTASVAGSAAAS